VIYHANDSNLYRFLISVGVGQVVVTPYGEGEIVAIIEATHLAGLRYKIALPFGIGFIRPESILHIAPGTGCFVRSNNRMQVTDLTMKGSGKLLDAKFSLMFANQHVYTFLRMYCLLVEILDDFKRRLHEKESAMQVNVPSDRALARPGAEATKSNYSFIMASLQKVLSKCMTALEFERICRTVSMNRVAQMAILPNLVEKCADILCKLGKDQTVFILHDYTMSMVKDPVKLRSYCLSVSESACYRIQFDKVSGWMYFSYLEPEQDLFEVPAFDDEDDDFFEEEQEIEATEDDQDEQMGEDVEGEAEDDGDESDDGEDGEIDAPDTKRPKLM
jgi:hypothetical protein